MMVFSPRMARLVLAGWIAVSILICAWLVGHVSRA